MENKHLKEPWGSVKQITEGSPGDIELFLVNVHNLREPKGPAIDCYQLKEPLGALGLFLLYIIIYPRVPQGYALHSVAVMIARSQGEPCSVTPGSREDVVCR